MVETHHSAISVWLIASRPGVSSAIAISSKHGRKHLRDQMIQCETTFQLRQAWIAPALACGENRTAVSPGKYDPRGAFAGATLVTQQRIVALYFGNKDAAA